MWLNRFRRSRPFIETARVDLGPAWAGNSVNCVPFRRDAVLTSANTHTAAYFDADGDVRLVEIDRDSGRRKEAVLANARKPLDAHQAISMGRDAQGRLHLAFGAHNETLLTTRSRSADLTEGFLAIEEAAGGATYPMFLSVRDELLRLFRIGNSKAGELWVERLQGDAWVRDKKPFISGLLEPWTAGPYLNQPVVAPDGTVHLFLVWRLPGKAMSGGLVVNAGIDAMRSTDGLRSLFTTSGVQLSLPVTPVNSERIVPVPLGASLINQAAAGLLPDGTPLFLTYWDDGNGVPQYRLGWPGAGGWQVSTVSAFRTPFRLDGGGTLPIPHSRPDLVCHRDGRITMIHRSAETGNRLMATKLQPPHYRLDSARTQVLVDQDLGFYEPILDRTAWEAREELVLYVQPCRQEMNSDGTSAQHAERAFLACFSPS
ncbi:BNR-4 repeat-containing protein [Terrihabitans rhizophilus]|uniref:BNR-4 repeat-containing protein n=1 Tax=Terrihabitans rhizophilus TaxID=3092662 RepID=UPI0029DE7266|nr:BNR-4 repeat-containing protein [Terrihabitans sp. PJ23]